MTGARKTVPGLGHFDGKTHVLPIRVYYEDTDLSGVVYHANYLRFMERARTEFFRLAGVDQDGRPGQRRAHRLGDPRGPSAAIIARRGWTITLTVQTVLHRHLRRAHRRATQKIYADDILLVEGRIEACIITLTGKPRRLPRIVARIC